MSLNFVRYTPEIETIDPDLDQLMERIIVILSFTFASSGKTSVKFTPGIFVEIFLNGLRMLSGRFSFGSHRSR